MTPLSLTLRLACLTYFCLAAPLQAPVHYHDNDSPWGQRAESGPDAEVPGWFKTHFFVALEVVEKK
jgi:hypothetical protein